jgi:hypothetical protein
MRLKSRVSAVVAALALFGSAPIVATANVASASSMASVTVVHGIPGVPVTVYANGKELIHKFNYTNVSHTVELAPGSYALALRPVGVPETATPILSTKVTLKAGENATVGADFDAKGGLVFSVFANPASPASKKTATVIVRHIAQAPGVDVYANGTKGSPLVSNLLNGAQAIAHVPAGRYTIAVYAHGSKGHPVIGPAKFKFVGGKTYVIYAIGSLSLPTGVTAVVQKY